MNTIPTRTEGNSDRVPHVRMNVFCSRRLVCGATLVLSVAVGPRHQNFIIPAVFFPLGCTCGCIHSRAPVGLVKCFFVAKYGYMRGAGGGILSISPVRNVPHTPIHIHLSPFAFCLYSLLVSDRVFTLKVFPTIQL